MAMVLNGGKAPGAAARDWRVAVGLASMYIWTWLLYWGGALSLRASTMELVNVRWGANVVACAAACGLASFAVRRWCTGERLMGILHVAGPACCLAGTLLSVGLVLDPTPEGALFTLAAVVDGVFTGAGEGLLLCLWCKVTSSTGVRSALLYNVVALAAGGLLFLACNVAPSWVSFAASVLCSVAGFACSRPSVLKGLAVPEPAVLDAAAARDAAAGDIDPDGAASDAAAAPGPAAIGPAPAAPDAVADARSRRVRFVPADRSVRMLLAIALVFGFSCGFMNASFEVVPKELYWVSCWGVVVGTILASALTLVTAFALKMDAWQLEFQTALPLMALAYILFPYDLFHYIGPGVHALGYQYFFITFWSLLGSRQLERSGEAGGSVSFGLFVIQTGAVLGLALWNVACAGIGDDGLRIVSSVAALAILLVALLFERPRFGWGNVRPGVSPTRDVPAAPTYDEVLGRICEKFGLSPRERDVCALLGRGRNRQFVADELGISLETAKTHATNVYRKLDVHSQQDLLDVIEMTGEAMTREREQTRGEALR